MLLEDAVQRNAEHPETFMIPGERERLGIVAGDVVKLMFKSTDSVERMWVEVLSADPLLGCTGVLRNHPQTLADLRFGDEIPFDFHNIIDIG